jgi:DNA-binding MarR family transcriptional regulator
MAKRKKESVGQLDNIKTPREDQLLRELFQIHHILINHFSREVGIAPARLKLLHEFLHSTDEGFGICDLAKRLSVTPALVTRQVQDLEKDGLIIRKADKRDGRRSRVSLSSKGYEEIRRLHERAHEFGHALLVSLSDKDIATATRVLMDIREKIELLLGSGQNILKSPKPGKSK